MRVSSVLKNLSVDCVVFGYEEDSLKVLLRQEFITYRGKTYEEWKLPGNHVYRNETIEDTAIRILREQSGATENVYMKKLSVFSDLDRLKTRDRDYKWKKEKGLADDRVVTIAFYSLVNVSDIDAGHLHNVVRWHKVSEVRELIFDHKKILETALLTLRNDLLNKPILFELLPELFTLTQIQTLYEIILDTTFDKRNFRRKISQMKYLVPSGKRQENVNHKPAMLYSFDRELYTKTQKARFDFSM